jgi:high-affinity nickel-transport protein
MITGLDNSKGLHLTVFGRSVLLIVAELLFNAVCWTLAGILLGRNKDTRSILSLTLLAWVRSINSLVGSAVCLYMTDNRPPTRQVLFVVTDT